MTFPEAVEAYQAHFGFCYPYAIGFGYPGKTDAENIAIIEKAIQENQPVDFHPHYDDGCDY